MQCRHQGAPRADERSAAIREHPEASPSCHSPDRRPSKGYEDGSGIGSKVSFQAATTCFDGSRPWADWMRLARHSVREEDASDVDARLGQGAAQEPTRHAAERFADLNLRGAWRFADEHQLAHEVPPRANSFTAIGTSEAGFNERHAASLRCPVTAIPGVGGSWVRDARNEAAREASCGLVGEGGGRLFPCDRRLDGVASPQVGKFDSGRLLLCVPRCPARQIRVRRVGDSVRVARQARAMIACLAALMLVVVAVAAWPRELPIVPATKGSLPPQKVWPTDFVVEPGDRVVGVGQLVDPDGQPPRLCTGLDVIWSATYHCTSLSVIVSGVDVASLPGVRRSNGATYVDAVVHGGWDGGTLRVDQVGGPALTFPVSPELDCEYTVPGAIGDPQAGGQEGPYRQLQSIIDGDPTTYAGIWRSNSGGPALVVATTKDLVLAGALLRASFPFALCLVHVTYSMSDLNAMAARLRLPSGVAWRPEVDVRRNRVLVRVPVLAASTVQAAGGQAGIELVPLVFKDWRG